MSGPRLFHGGIPGLNVGDRLEPPDRTGNEHSLTLLSRAMPDPLSHVPRTDRVYLTTRRDAARAFAALYPAAPGGAVYEAVPDGDTEPDPDAPGESVMCRSALIVAVVRPVVVFAHRTPQSWLRMLAGGPPP